MTPDEQGAASDNDLGSVMSRVARQLQEEHGDTDATLQAITTAAVSVVPHVQDCGISFVIGRTTVEARAWSSDLPREVDALQNRLQQGPCLDAVWDELVVRVDDVAGDPRWPAFTVAAAAAGVGSMLASHAAIALAGAQREEGLYGRMTHRDAIGQAKGILMERYKVTADEAFGLLVRSSSVTNRKLRDIADDLASTGTLPTDRH
ncbi:hypothetical protein ASG36_19800 [Geodermatophilus sp. Leaf369]|uniref:ANTAR domain-containing protein n=1 Tax=Geodermatophilus sp. Leaf369 TaxID=1736354 RepID=UPI0006FBD18E|nr:ANTAR domain-containing protein [Geodermatophilus sp. Leaf369]KQS54705.1 hypothetical protein ASG36_19800 [Geodermatophilus sp. Leaf369]